jgi:iron complex transport system substrate-binding protein
MIDENNQLYPKRIVSLSPSNTEILFALGAGKKLVGVTDYCNYPNELKPKIKTEEITRVGGYWNPSIKTIISLEPELVLISTAHCTVKTNKCKNECDRKCELTTKIANKLNKSSINVVSISPHSIKDVLDNILFIGKLVGKSTQAIKLVRELKQRIELVMSKSNTIVHKPKVYFEVWNEPYISVNSKTWIGNIINLAGGKNIFGEAVSEWPIIRSEDIIKKNPDLIVFPVIPNIPRFWGSFETVKNRFEWENINAIKNNLLFEVSRDCISRPGPRLIDSLELFSKIINQHFK